MTLIFLKTRDIVYRFNFLIMLATFLYMPIALAHNVVSGAYTDGMTIEGEVGFSNGDMAEAGSPISVFDEAGKLIAELQLTEGGVFTYEAKAVSKHIFKVNLSAGHVAEMVIEVDELTAPTKSMKMLESNAVQSTMVTTKSGSLVELSREGSATGEVVFDSKFSTEQLQRIVRSAVAKQIKPLQKELRAYKEKVMFRDIAGGLGFIFGLFGVAAWMASKRNREED